MDKSEFLQKVYALNYEVRIFPKATINWYLLLEWTAEDLFATKTIIRESYLYSLSIREDSDPGFKKKISYRINCEEKKKKRSNFTKLLTFLNIKRRVNEII